MSSSFGGQHTERKLAVIADYLRSYCVALKNQPFRKVYIDAFAGSGFRTPKADSELPLFRDATDLSVYTGSALRALDVEPGFDEFLFIEGDDSSFKALNQHVRSHPKGQRAQLFHADANMALGDIVRKVNWANHRGVLFLDPYGMQVEWQTLVAVARTEKIDVWYLCPIGLGYNRLLPRNAPIPESWRRVLNRSLGTSDWEKSFYTRTEGQTDLLGTRSEIVARSADLDDIEKYVIRRLRTIFRGGVTDEALRLGLPGKSPMYSLVFACGNPLKAASTLALRLARAALKKGSPHGRRQ